MATQASPIQTLSLPGFCSGTYQARSPLSQAEEAINIFPENDGSATGRATFYQVPGLELYLALPTGPVQGQIEANYRTFVVSGGVFYEIHDNQTYTSYGNVGAGNPVSMATNGSPSTTVNDTTDGQILIISNQLGYLFDLGTNTLAPITDPGFPIYATNVTVLDGYFVVGNFASREFNVSQVSDGSQWTDASGLPMFASKEGSSDNLQAVLSTRRTLIVFGFETTEVWWDAGASGFPFQPIQGALLEQGLACPTAFVVADDGAYWLGSDRRGNAQFWGEVNLSPARISNFAIENFLNQFASLDDCVAGVYQESGHTFLLWHFPTARCYDVSGTYWDSCTICYDKTTGQWHKRAQWDTATGQWLAAIARYHSFSFAPPQNVSPSPGVITDGIHLVGDYRNGNLYIQSQNYYSDNGSLIRRLRRAPNVINQNFRNAFYRLELFCQVGTAAQNPQPGWQPIINLRYSDDGGYTWSNDKAAYAGHVGQYSWRVIWRQLGSGRDRVFEVWMDDDIPCAWTEAFVRISPGNG